MHAFSSFLNWRKKCVHAKKYYFDTNKWRWKHPFAGPNIQTKIVDVFQEVIDKTRPVIVQDQTGSKTSGKNLWSLTLQQKTLLVMSKGFKVRGPQGVRVRGVERPICARRLLPSMHVNIHRIIQQLIWCAKYCKYNKICS